MAITDLPETQAASATFLVGADSTGLEQTPVKSTVNADLGTADVANTSALDKTITLVTGTPQEVKVGSARLVARKYVMIQATVTGMKYGFSSTSQSFDAFKNQRIFIPVGDAIAVWVSGNGVMSIGELA